MPVFYGPVDLGKNELRNAVVQNLGAAPGTPVKGQLYFDSTGNILYWYNGAGWVAAQGGAGAVPATTVTTSAVGDASVVGVATTYTREDHKHGREAFAAVTAATTYGIAAGNGAAVTLPRSDHTHGTPSLTATAPTVQALGDSAGVGVGTDPARNDHRHGMPAFGGTVTSEGTFNIVSNIGAATTVARSDHTHGSPTHVDGDHAAIHLNALAAPTVDVTLNSHKIVNLLDPTTAQDGATKNYVDNVLAGLSWKDSCRVASAVGANVAAITGALTIDGVAVAANDRVLLKDQTTTNQNGIYIANLAGAWTRATDADIGTEVQGMAVFIEEGTTMADTAWTCTTNAPITVGTTGLTFVQFAGGGSVTAGAGMTQAGNVLNVIAGDTSLTVNADELHVNTGVMATVASLASYVPTTRQVIAGAGLTGGGALSADATVNVIAGDTSLTVAADSVVVNTGVIATVASVTAAVTGMAKKFAAALAGTASPEVITHNLNTRDIQLTVLNGASPYTAVEVDWDATTVNTVTIRYVPNLGAGYRVVVVG